MKNDPIPFSPWNLTEPPMSWSLDDGLINGVIAAAVRSVGQRPMMPALDRGVRKTKEDTLDAFFFQAMVDRLLEVFHMLYPD